MEAVTLSDLWPIIVAVLGPMLLCVTVLAKYQHLAGDGNAEAA